MGKLPGQFGWKYELADHANWKCQGWHPAKVVSKLIAGVWVVWMLRW